MPFLKNMKLPGENDRKTWREKALSKVCRKRWRMLDLAAGSPTPPMRINSASALFEGELYLFGGLNAGPSNSLWALSVRDRRWRPIPAQKGTPPAPRQGHTLCWDGASSLWVFGGQGIATSSTDFSRTHQGVKIRTLAKRTCFDDFHEFDTRTHEWRDHVQAGISPTSRRGHTATLVRNRRVIKPKAAVPTSFQASKLVAKQQAKAGGADNPQGRVHARAMTGNNTANSPRRTRKMVVGDGAVNRPSNGKVVEQDSGGRSPKRGSFHGGDENRHKGVRAKFHGRVRDGRGKEAKGQVSREMFIIGGAGTDPIRLWIFDFDLNSWTCVGTDSNGDGGICVGPAPPAVFDHTATLVGNNEHIIVVGGIMVGRALNSQVFMLALDTLQWSTLTPHPLGCTAPAVHGHTAVEDPTHADRIVVFGGHGGTHWNMEVLTLSYKQCIWSMAVCETASLPQLSSSRRNIAMKTIDKLAERIPNADGINTAAVCAVRDGLAQMPHQRSGHTCFVWDPRDYVAHAGGSSSNACDPAITRGDETMRNERGDVSDQGASIPSADRFRVGSGRGSVLPRQREDCADGPLSYPCIIAFGGSALRVGGGYVEAALHVLEEHNRNDKDDEHQEQAEEGRESSSVEGVSGALKPSISRRKSFSKFQTCSNSVFLQLHSMRQLRTQQLTFHHKICDADLSYVEFRIRSVILGERTVNIHSKDDYSDNTPHSVLSTGGGETPMPPEKGRLGVFPTGYEQVKAFLGESRPVDPNRRPISAPAHSGNVVGGCGGFSDLNINQGVLPVGFGRKKGPVTAGAGLEEAGHQALGARSLLDHALRISGVFLRPAIRQCSNLLPMMRPQQRSSTGMLNTLTGNRSSIMRSVTTAPRALGVGSEVSYVGAGDGGSLTLGCVRSDGSCARDNDSAMFSRIPAPSRAMRARFGRHGRPLLLPKPTLAAHNGRLLMGYGWTGSDLYR